MNCAHVRERLAVLVYGDMTAEEAAALREHLAACPACRQEHAALEQLRQLLDAVPPVPADGAVDLTRLYRAAAQRQAVRQRRWRRGACAAGAVAAALLAFALLPHLELRLDAHQLTLRWGTLPATPAVVPPPRPVVAPAPEVARSPTPVTTDLDKRLKVVEELVQILTSDLDTRDERLRQALARIQAHLQRLQARSEARAVSFNPPEKGETP